MVFLSSSDTKTDAEILCFLNNGRFRVYHFQSARHFFQWNWDNFIIFKTYNSFLHYLLKALSGLYLYVGYILKKFFCK